MIFAVFECVLLALVYVMATHATNVTSSISTGEYVTLKSTFTHQETPSLPQTTSGYTSMSSAVPQALTSPSVEATKIPLYIGGLLPFTTPNGGWDGSGLLPSIDLALEQVNAREDLLSEYELRVVWNDTQCDPGLGSRVFFDQINREPQKIMILGGGCSVSSEAIAVTAHYWNLITVSPTAVDPGLSDREKFPLFYRLYPPEQAFNAARVAMMRHFGWTRVATIHQNENLFSLTVDDLITRMKEANITVISTESFTGNPRNQIESLKKQDARIIVAFMYEEKAQELICEALKLNMTGDGYVWMFPDWYDTTWWDTNYEEQTIDCTKEDLRRAIRMSYHLTVGVQALSTSDDLTIGNITASEYDAYINDQFDNNPKYSNLKYTSDHPFGYDTLWAMALVLNKTSEILETTTLSDGRMRRLEDFNYDDMEIRKVLFDSFKEVSFLGVSGPVLFHGGDREGIGIIRQLHSDLVKHNVGEFDPSDGLLHLNGDITWPGGKLPLDRTVHAIIRRLMTVGEPVYISMCILTALAILLAFVFLGFNIKFRKQRYIRLSSPNLNNFIIAGGILVYTSIFVSGVNTQLVSYSSKVSCCQLNIWLLSVGFVLAFGSMFSKTWRVYQVAAFKKPKRKVITDQDLYKMVAMLLCIDIIILIVWQAFDPMKLVVKELREREDSSTANQIIISYTESCDCNYLIHFLVTLFIYKGLLLLFGAFLAWETRKTTILGLNDSKFIGICIYNVTILCIIGTTVSFLFNDNPTASYLFISGIILFCNTVTLLVIFIPKIRSVWKHPKGDINRSGSFLQSRTSRYSEREASVSISNLTEENDVLRATIAALTHKLDMTKHNRCCEMGCLSFRLTCVNSEYDDEDIF